MRYTVLLSALLFCFGSYAQKAENVIIVTTDGFRWQEVFKGMDSAIAVNPAYNQRDSAGIFRRYWSESVSQRRAVLMPFLWSTVAKKGQLYGNRELGNKINVANPYWFSYPGYSEIFTGFVDTTINTNSYPANPNTNLLEFINKQPNFKGKVAAFCGWDALENVLAEKRSHVPVLAGMENSGGINPDSDEQLMNKMKQDSYAPWDNGATDVFTHYAAFDHLKKRQPRVLYISYGETDEWAHEGHYKDYLNAAHRVDKWLGDIWNYVQSDSIYKNKTVLFVTVDHGRGDADKTQWTSHRSYIPGSDQIWFAVIGPGIAPKGEVKSEIQLYQQQYAETIAELLELKFTCEHPVSQGFTEVLR